MKIELLKDVTNLQELKTIYFKLAKQYHPDLQSGNIELMQLLNNEYDYLKGILTNDININSNAYKETSASMEGFKDIINDLIRFEGIELNIVGTWIYIKDGIKGSTYAIKEYLKSQYHCRYSKPHKAWYWFEGIENSSKTRGNKKYYDKNVKTYGIETIKSKGSFSLK